MHQQHRRFLSITLCLVFVSFALAGCTTPDPKNFGMVHVGMDKMRVVETIGSPTMERRWQGKDRWIYEIHNNDDITIKEIHFQDGFATYIGAPPKPPVSAAEQDKMNAAAIAQDDERASVENARREQLLGASRTRTAQEPEDATDRKLRESLYGIEPDPKNESNRFVPQFEPVR